MRLSKHFYEGEAGIIKTAASAISLILLIIFSFSLRLYRVTQMLMMHPYAKSGGFPGKPGCGPPISENDDCFSLGTSGKTIFLPVALKVLHCWTHDPSDYSVPSCPL